MCIRDSSQTAISVMKKNTRDIRYNQKIKLALNHENSSRHQTGTIVTLSGLPYRNAFEFHPSKAGNSAFISNSTKSNNITKNTITPPKNLSLIHIYQQSIL